MAHGIRVGTCATVCRRNRRPLGPSNDGGKPCGPASARVVDESDSHFSTAWNGGQYGWMVAPSRSKPWHTGKDLNSPLVLRRCPELNATARYNVRMHRILFAIGVCLLGAGSFDTLVAWYWGWTTLRCGRRGRSGSLPAKSRGSRGWGRAAGGSRRDDVGRGRERPRRTKERRGAISALERRKRHRSNCPRSFPAFESTPRHTT